MMLRNWLSVVWSKKINRGFAQITKHIHSNLVVCLHNNSPCCCTKMSQCMTTQWISCEKL